MNKTQAKIAARLEQAFATHGFAELGVAELRTQAAVSLRTLYKYFPSRDDMVLAALEHRHARYAAFIFDDLPDSPDDALELIFERIGAWMSANAAEGCLFHNAVAAQPHSAALKAMRERHKRDVAERLAGAANLPNQQTELMLIHEGLTQVWPLQKEQGVTAAKTLVAALRRALPLGD